MVSVPERTIGRLILAAPLSPSQLRSWFAAFGAAQEQAGSTSDTGLIRFRTVLAERADAAGLSREAEEFFRYLDTEGSRVDEQVIRATADLRDALPDQYETLSRFAWLTDAQWDQLDSMWGPEWADALGAQLDARWPDADSLSDADLQTRLDELIAEFLSPDPAQPGALEPGQPPSLPAPEAAAADLLALALAARAELEGRLGRPLALTEADLVAETAKAADTVAAGPARQ